MISPQEQQEAYQRALAWVGEQITAAERQGLTLDYLGGWHTFKPDPKTLERAWRVLYGIPDSMTHLLTSPEVQWALVIWRWEGHRHEREKAWFRHESSTNEAAWPGAGSHLDEIL